MRNSEVAKLNIPFVLNMIKDYPENDDNNEVENDQELSSHRSLPDLDQ